MAVYIGESKAELVRGDGESVALYIGDICIIPIEEGDE